MSDINLWIILGAAFLGGLIPGPGMLAIAGTAMARGRRYGFAVAYGMTAGGFVWATFAGLGMGAILVSNQWLFEILKYVGAAYLGWLGWRSARAAMRPNHTMSAKDVGTDSLWVSAVRGALIHLTNPKALIFWGSIFAIGLKPGAPPAAMLWVISISMMVNVFLMTTYALVFSKPGMMAGYVQFRRWIEGAFALFFAGAAIYLVTSREQ
jgi:threonine/homoserine/homoserine lactone efflux protein